MVCVVVMLLCFADDCPAGNHFDIGAAACRPCPLGQYQPWHGHLKCLACPPYSSTKQPVCSAECWLKKLM